MLILGKSVLKYKINVSFCNKISIFFGVVNIS